MGHFAGPHSALTVLSSFKKGHGKWKLCTATKKKTNEIEKNAKLGLLLLASAAAVVCKIRALI